jgi:hypothetical protein
MVYACQALDLTKQEAGAAAPLGNGGNSVKIGALKEIFDGENRVAMTPDSALQLVKLGHSCCIEAGAGAKAGFSDALYAAAGVEVLKNAKAVIEAADVLVKVRGPEEKEAKLLREGQTLISFFWPAQNEALLKLVAERGATVVAMDMVPRISRAQKMDALSSMANIAGYRAVIEAGNNFGRFFTGQVTAAGKVPPAKVLVVGAGVAGLAAIGTVHRDPPRPGIQRVFDQFLHRRGGPFHHLTRRDAVDHTLIQLADDRAQRAYVGAVQDHAPICSRVWQIRPPFRLGQPTGC